ncbi:MAG: hypothetical protein VST70_05970 [Nitrospirota bacterium]|nr:hypothetical protein [Nitrospirota bacterium]
MNSAVFIETQKDDKFHGNPIDHMQPRSKSKNLAIIVRIDGVDQITWGKNIKTDSLKYGNKKLSLKTTKLIPITP